jgi:hypothetical protein
VLERWPADAHERALIMSFREQFVSSAETIMATNIADTWIDACT